MSHDKKDAQGPRSIKVPDLELSEPRISDLFGTLAQVCSLRHFCSQNSRIVSGDVSSHRMKKRRGLCRSGCGCCRRIPSVTTSPKLFGVGRRSWGVMVTKWNKDTSKVNLTYTRSKAKRMSNIPVLVLSRCLQLFLS